MPPPPDDTPAAVHAIRAVLHTNRHAQMFLDMLVGELGTAARVETRNGGKLIHVFRADADGWVAPWRLASMSLTGRQGVVVNLSEPDEDDVPAPPVPVPRLRGLGPGEITLYDGPWSVTVTYRAEGVRMESSYGGPPALLAGAAFALEEGQGSAVGRLATYLARLDTARHGAARVFLPEPLPEGVAGAWRVARPALNEALWYGHVGPGPMWLAADGYSGVVTEAAVSRDEVLGRWRQAVDRVRPAPPAPVAMPDPGPDFVRPLDLGPDMFGFEARMTGPKADVPRPEPTPANTPCVLVEVPGPPPTPPPWGAWVPQLDVFGQTHYAARRPEADGGFTLAGHELLDVLGPEAITRGMDEVMAKGPVVVPLPPGIDRPAVRYAVTRVAFRDEFTLDLITPRRSASHQGPELHLPNLDATHLPWAVYRMSAMT